MPGNADIFGELNVNLTGGGGGTQNTEQIYNKLQGVLNVLTNEVKALTRLTQTAVNAAGAPDNPNARRPPRYTQEERTGIALAGTEAAKTYIQVAKRQADEIKVVMADLKQGAGVTQDSLKKLSQDIEATGAELRNMLRNNNRFRGSPTDIQVMGGVNRETRTAYKALVEERDKFAVQANQARGSVPANPRFDQSIRSHFSETFLPNTFGPQAAAQFAQTGQASSFDPGSQLDQIAQRFIEFGVDQKLVVRELLNLANTVGVRTEGGRTDIYGIAPVSGAINPAGGGKYTERLRGVAAQIREANPEASAEQLGRKMINYFVQQGGERAGAIRTRKGFGDLQSLTDLDFARFLQEAVGLAGQAGGASRTDADVAKFSTQMGTQIGNVLQKVFTQRGTGQGSAGFTLDEFNSDALSEFFAGNFGGKAKVIPTQFSREALREVSKGGTVTVGELDKLQNRLLELTGVLEGKGIDTADPNLRPEEARTPGDQQLIREFNAINKQLFGVVNQALGEGRNPGGIIPGSNLLSEQGTAQASEKWFTENLARVLGLKGVEFKRPGPRTQAQVEEDERTGVSSVNKATAQLTTRFEKLANVVNTASDEISKLNPTETFALIGDLINAAGIRGGARGVNLPGGGRAEDVRTLTAFGEAGLSPDISLSTVLPSLRQKSAFGYIDEEGSRQLQASPFALKGFQLRADQIKEGTPGVVKRGDDLGIEFTLEKAAGKFENIFIRVGETISQEMAQAIFNPKAISASAGRFPQYGSDQDLFFGQAGAFANLVKPIGLSGDKRGSRTQGDLIRAAVTAADDPGIQAATLEAVAEATRRAQNRARRQDDAILIDPASRRGDIEDQGLSRIFGLEGKKNFRSELRDAINASGGVQEYKKQFTEQNPLRDTILGLLYEKQTSGRGAVNAADLNVAERLDPNAEGISEAERQRRRQASAQARDLAAGGAVGEGREFRATVNTNDIKSAVGGALGPLLRIFGGKTVSAGDLDNFLSANNPKAQEQLKKKIQTDELGNEFVRVRTGQGGKGKEYVDVSPQEYAQLQQQVAELLKLQSLEVGGRVGGAAQAVTPDAPDVIDITRAQQGAPDAETVRQTDALAKAQAKVTEARREGAAIKPSGALHAPAVGEVVRQYKDLQKVLAQIGTDITAIKTSVSNVSNLTLGSFAAEIKSLNQTQLNRFKTIVDGIGGIGKVSRDVVKDLAVLQTKLDTLNVDKLKKQVDEVATAFSKLDSPVAGFGTTHTISAATSTGGSSGGREQVAQLNTINKSLEAMVKFQQQQTSAFEKLAQAIQNLDKGVKKTAEATDRAAKSGGGAGGGGGRTPPAPPAPGGGSTGGGGGGDDDPPITKLVYDHGKLFQVTFKGNKKLSTKEVKVGYDIASSEGQRAGLVEFPTGASRRLSEFERAGGARQARQADNLDLTLASRLVGTEINRGRYLNQRVSVDEVVRKLYEGLSRQTQFTGGKLEGTAIDAQTGRNRKVSVVDLASLGLSSQQQKTLGSRDYSQPVELSISQQERVFYDFVRQLEHFINRSRREAADRGVGTTRNIREMFGSQEVLANIRDPASGARLKTLAADVDSNGRVIVKSLSAASEQFTIFARQTRSALRRVALWGSASYVIYGVVQQFRNMVNVTAEVDERMRKLQFLMNRTSTDFKNLATSAFEVSREYGQSVSQTLDAMVVFAQQGRAQAEVINLVKASLAAANQTELSAAAATEALTAAMAIFNTEARDAMRIIDAWANVANNNAVTAVVLANALKKVGATVQLVGVDFHEFNALVTTVAANTRKSGQEIGTSLKFIFQAVQRPDVVKALEDMGVAVFASANQTRPFIDILQDMRDRFASLSDQQRVVILQTVASRRHYADLAVILKDLDQISERVNDSQNSFGTAARNNAIVMEGFNKRIASMRAAISEAGVTLANSGMIQALEGITEAGTFFARRFAEVPGILLSTVSILGVFSYGLNLASRAMIGVGGQGLPNLTRGIQANNVATQLAIKLGKDNVARIQAEANSYEVFTRTLQKNAGALKLSAAARAQIDRGNPEFFRTAQRGFVLAGANLPGGSADSNRVLQQEARGYASQQNSFRLQTGATIGAFAAAAFAGSFADKLRDSNEFASLGKDVGASVLEGIQKAGAGASFGILAGGFKGGIIGAALGGILELITAIGEFGDVTGNAIERTDRFSAAIKSNIDAVRQLRDEISGINESGINPLTGRLEFQEFPTTNNAIETYRRYADALGQLGKLESGQGFNARQQINELLGDEGGSGALLPLTNLDTILDNLGDTTGSLDRAMRELGRSLDKIAQANTLQYFAKLRGEMVQLGIRAEQTQKVLQNPSFGGNPLQTGGPLTRLFPGLVRATGGVQNFLGFDNAAQKSFATADALKQRGVFDQLLRIETGTEDQRVAQLRAASGAYNQFEERMTAVIERLRGSFTSDPRARQTETREALSTLTAGLGSLIGNELRAAGFDPAKFQTEDIPVALQRFRETGTNNRATILLESFGRTLADINQAVSTGTLGTTRSNIADQFRFNQEQGFTSAFQGAITEDGRVDVGRLRDLIKPGMQAIFRKGGEFQSIIADSVDQEGMYDVVFTEQKDGLLTGFREVQRLSAQQLAETVDKLSSQYDQLQISQTGVRSQRFFSGIVEDVQKGLRDLSTASGRLLTIYKKRMSQFTDELKIAQTIVKETVPNIQDQLRSLNASVGTSNQALQAIFGESRLRVNALQARPATGLTQRSGGVDYSEIQAQNRVADQTAALSAALDSDRVLKREEISTTRGLIDSNRQLINSIAELTFQQLNAAKPNISSILEQKLDKLESGLRSETFEDQKILLTDFLDSATGLTNIQRGDALKNFANDPRATIRGFREEIGRSFTIDQLLASGQAPSSFSALSSPIYKSTFSGDPVGLVDLRDALQSTKLIINRVAEVAQSAQLANPLAQRRAVTQAGTLIDQGRAAAARLGSVPDILQDDKGGIVETLAEFADPKKVAKAIQEVEQQIESVTSAISEYRRVAIDAFSGQALASVQLFGNALSEVDRAGALSNLVDSFEALRRLGEGSFAIRGFANVINDAKDIFGRSIGVQDLPLNEIADQLADASGLAADRIRNALVDGLLEARTVNYGQVLGDIEGSLKQTLGKHEVFQDLSITTDSINTFRQAIEKLISQGFDPESDAVQRLTTVYDALEQKRSSQERFFDDSKTRLLKNYAEQLLRAGAPAAAFDDQLRGIIKSSSELTRLGVQKGIIPGVDSGELGGIRGEVNQILDVLGDFSYRLRESANIFEDFSGTKELKFQTILDEDPKMRQLREFLTPFIGGGTFQLNLATNLSGFQGLPRKHSGDIAADETPAILQKGEAIIPRSIVPQLPGNILGQLGTGSSGLKYFMGSQLPMFHDGFNPTNPTEYALFALAKQGFVSGFPVVAPGSGTPEVAARNFNVYNQLENTAGTRTFYDFKGVVLDYEKAVERRLIEDLRSQLRGQGRAGELNSMLKDIGIAGIENNASRPGIEIIDPSALRRRLFQETVTPQGSPLADRIFEGRESGRRPRGIGSDLLPQDVVTDLADRTRGRFLGQGIEKSVVASDKTGLVVRGTYGHLRRNDPTSLYDYVGNKINDFDLITEHKTEARMSKLIQDLDPRFGPNIRGLEGVASPYKLDASEHLTILDSVFDRAKAIEANDLLAEINKSYRANPFLNRQFDTQGRGNIGIAIRGSEGYVVPLDLGFSGPIFEDQFERARKAKPYGVPLNDIDFLLDREQITAHYGSNYAKSIGAQPAVINHSISDLKNQDNLRYMAYDARMQNTGTPEKVTDHIKVLAARGKRLQRGDSLINANPIMQLLDMLMAERPPESSGRVSTFGLEAGEFSTRDTAILDDLLRRIDGGHGQYREAINPLKGNNTGGFVDPLRIGPGQHDYTALQLGLNFNETPEVLRTILAHEGSHAYSLGTKEGGRGLNRIIRESRRSGNPIAQVSNLIDVLSGQRGLGLDYLRENWIRYIQSEGLIREGYAVPNVDYLLDSFNGDQQLRQDFNEVTRRRGFGRSLGSHAEYLDKLLADGKISEGDHARRTARLKKWGSNSGSELRKKIRSTYDRMALFDSAGTPEFLDFLKSQTFRNFASETWAYGSEGKQSVKVLQEILAGNRNSMDLLGADPALVDQILQEVDKAGPDKTTRALERAMQKWIDINFDDYASDERGAIRRVITGNRANEFINAGGEAPIDYIKVDPNAPSPKSRFGKNLLRGTLIGAGFLAGLPIGHPLEVAGGVATALTVDGLRGKVNLGDMYRSVATRVSKPIYKFGQGAGRFVEGATREFLNTYVGEQWINKNVLKPNNFSNISQMYRALAREGGFAETVAKLAKQKGDGSITRGYRDYGITDFFYEQTKGGPLDPIAKTLIEAARQDVTRFRYGQTFTPGTATGDASALGTQTRGITPQEFIRTLGAVEEATFELERLKEAKAPHEQILEAEKRLRTIRNGQVLAEFDVSDIEGRQDRFLERREGPKDYIKSTRSNRPINPLDKNWIDVIAEKPELTGHQELDRRRRQLAKEMGVRPQDLVIEKIGDKYKIKTKDFNRQMKVFNAMRPEAQARFLEIIANNKRGTAPTTGRSPGAGVGLNLALGLIGDPLFAGLAGEGLDLDALRTHGQQAALAYGGFQAAGIGAKGLEAALPRLLGSGILSKGIPVAGNILGAEFFGGLGATELTKALEAETLRGRVVHGGASLGSAAASIGQYAAAGGAIGGGIGAFFGGVGAAPGAAIGSGVGAVAGTLRTAYKFADQNIFSVNERTKLQDEMREAAEYRLQVDFPALKEGIARGVSEGLFSEAQGKGILQNFLKAQQAQAEGNPRASNLADDIVQRYTGNSLEMKVISSRIRGKQQQVMAELDSFFEEEQKRAEAIASRRGTQVGLGFNIGRFSTGLRLAADEFPAILHKGEAVIPSHLVSSLPSEITDQLPMRVGFGAYRTGLLPPSALIDPDREKREQAYRQRQEGIAGINTAYQEDLQRRSSELADTKKLLEGVLASSNTIDELNNTLDRRQAGEVKDTDVLNFLRARETEIDGQAIKLNKVTFDNFIKSLQPIVPFLETLNQDMGKDLFPIDKFKILTNLDFVNDIGGSAIGRKETAVAREKNLSNLADYVSKTTQIFDTFSSGRGNEAVYNALLSNTDQTKEIVNNLAKNRLTQPLATKIAGAFAAAADFSNLNINDLQSVVEEETRALTNAGAYNVSINDRNMLMVGNQAVGPYGLAQRAMAYHLGLEGVFSDQYGSIRTLVDSMKPAQAQFMDRMDARGRSAASGFQALNMIREMLGTNEVIKPAFLNQYIKRLGVSGVTFPDKFSMNYLIPDEGVIAQLPQEIFQFFESVSGIRLSASGREKLIAKDALAKERGQGSLFKEGTTADQIQSLNALTLGDLAAAHGRSGEGEYVDNDLIRNNLRAFEQWGKYQGAQQLISSEIRKRNLTFDQFVRGGFDNQDEVYDYIHNTLKEQILSNPQLSRQGIAESIAQNEGNNRRWLDFWLKNENPEIANYARQLISGTGFSTYDLVRGFSPEGDPIPGQLYRDINNELRARASYYHTGTAAADEGLAILQKGEVIIPRALIPAIPDEIMSRLPGGNMSDSSRVAAVQQSAPREEKPQQVDVNIPTNVNVIVDGKGRGDSPSDVRSIINEALNDESIKKRILDAPLSILFR